MTQPIVTLQNLVFGPSSTKRLPYILNATVSPGTILWIQGPNGSGKSSLLQTLLTNGHIFSGHISMPPYETVAYLPQLQNKRVPWPMTLNDVLLLSGLSSSSHPLLSSDMLDTAWNTSSGGERQRLLLTRLFKQNPSLIMIDEPLNHLDTSSKHAVIQLLKTYVENQGALIIVEHDTIPSELMPYITTRITLGDV